MKIYLRHLFPSRDDSDPFSNVSEKALFVSGVDTAYTEQHKNCRILNINARGPNCRRYRYPVLNKNL